MKKFFFKTSYRILCAALAAAVVLPFSPEAYALTGEFQCGLEEHTHYDACYTPVLICELEETPEYHVHDDNYLRSVLLQIHIFYEMLTLHLLLKIQSLNLQMPVQKSV